VQTTTTWCWDEPFFLGGSGASARDGVAVMPDKRGNNFKGRWGSAHASGTNFVFGDGSVRLINYDVSASTMSALLTPNGGEVPPDF
jgi:prepilin-type processing-associated H-X9-DG protein